MPGDCGDFAIRTPILLSALAFLFFFLASCCRLIELPLDMLSAVNASFKEE